jgi:hypothetical protein
MVLMVGGEWGSRPSGSLNARGIPTAPSSPKQRMALAGLGAEASTLTGGGIILGYANEQ